MMTTHHRERLRSCTESIDHGSGRLLKILEGYDINELFKDHREKHAHSQNWRESSPTGKREISDTSTVDTHFSNNCNNSERENESSSNHGNIEYSPDYHSDDNSTSFSGSENSCHSVASR
jgi:hypothetical protein